MPVLRGMDLQKTCSKCGKEYPYETAICTDDGFPLVVVSEKLIRASKIGQRYVLEEEIGQGGMGAIFKARHIAMDRQVAIKVLLADISKDPQAMMRFQVEARAASILSHPNIITIHEFDITEQGIPFLVMEYLEGFTLHDLLAKRNRLPYEEALPIFIKVCSALSHAHNRNVVHRDLKPSNIMIVVDENGESQPKLLDFGIAKLFTPPGKTAMRLTQTGEVFGSPLYMSPEQCMGQAIDARSDIYSLGCVLYETLTGVAPIQGDNFLSLVYAHLRDEPLPFSKVASDFVVPAELEAIVQKSLHKDSTHRQASIKELQGQLETFSKNSNAKDQTKKIEISEDTQRAKILSNDIDKTYVATENSKLDELTRKAEAGDLDAQYELGCFYYDGNVVERDLNLALYWYAKAANEKFPDAVAWLGILYRNGEGVEQDDEKAIELFQQAAMLDNGFSQYLLADMYQRGCGTAVDADMAAYWYKKAVENNNLLAMNALGTCYETGFGVDPDMEKAAQFYLQAAEQGDSHAQNNIARFYAAGCGIEKNLEEAAAWYLNAALQGHVEAQCNLASCYAQGQGVDIDESEALTWMQMSADNGDSVAQSWMGFWYRHGMMGLDCDHQKAFHWYTKAAVKKYVIAQHELGYCFENGLGVRQDLKQAVTWYKRAADQGAPEAQFALACCYRDGSGTAKNTTKYVELLEAAADSNMIEALYELGLHYEEVETDRKKAGKYYKRAADLGDSRAKERLLKGNFS
jgi:TPR repeat protein/tRNA A-37 threonylcarbamoyl transferase component Bud32